MVEERRHQYWVDTKVQWLFTMTILAVMTFSAAAGAIVAFCINVIITSTEVGMWPLAYLSSGAANVLTILFLMVAFMALMLVYGILASHKIAGPLMAIRHGLRRIREGDIDQTITIRHDDWVHSLVDDLNATFQVLKNKNEMLMGRIRQVSCPREPGIGSAPEPEGGKEFTHSESPNPENVH